MSKETAEVFQRIAELSEKGYMISFRPQRNGSILCKIQRGEVKVSGLGMSIPSAFKNCEKNLNIMESSKVVKTNGLFRL